MYGIKMIDPDTGDSVWIRLQFGAIAEWPTRKPAQHYIDVNLAPYTINYVYEVVKIESRELM